MRWIPAIFLLLLTFSASTQPISDPAPLNYRSHAEEARFHALTSELRCVQCQNQSLADSNAQIAHDLRREVLKLMQEGLTDNQIKQFLVERYGEFVLYRPPMQGGTLVLWFAPIGLLLIGGIALIRYIRHQRQALPAAHNDMVEDNQDERPW